MVTFSTSLALCGGIHRSPVNSPHKGLWRGALMFSLICAWIIGWVNNRKAGDLRCHHAHYDVTVMRSRETSTHSNQNWVFSSHLSVRHLHQTHFKPSLIARFMGPTWGPSGADRTHVGPMLAPWTLISGISYQKLHWQSCGLTSHKRNIRGRSNNN